MKFEEVLRAEVISISPCFHLSFHFKNIVKNILFLEKGSNNSSFENTDHSPKD